MGPIVKKITGEIKNSLRCWCILDGLAFFPPDDISVVLNFLLSNMAIEVKELVNDFDIEGEIIATNTTRWCTGGRPVTVLLTLSVWTSNSKL